MKTQKPKVAIIFTGGTISMSVDEEIGAAIPSLNGQDIISMVTNIDKLADIEIVEYSEIPGPLIRFDMLFEIRDIIEKLAAREDITGVIVTHGTDTLEESAYFWDLTLNVHKPVIVVGAMRNSSELGYDGPANLAAAVCTAISPKSVDKGVLVVLNNEVNTALEVTKTNTLSLNTFQSRYGPIGIIDTNDFVVHRNITGRDHIDTDGIEKNVFLIKSCIDMDPKIIDFYLSQNAKGIVIEAMGRGNLPPTFLPYIKKAIDQKVAVIIVSRCPSGRVMSSYGYEGGGKMLHDLGVIFGGELSGQKARIKLMLALHRSDDMGYIRTLFEDSYVY
ncbi:MAG: asparaginase [Peptostreptococcaceae bacterium]|nr:asparaginase [Peptostreptococcaceae bacterium]